MTREFWNIFFFTMFIIGGLYIFRDDMAIAFTIAFGMLFLKQWGEEL